jgi:putative tricarboxylic transport membrane protein
VLPLIIGVILGPMAEKHGRRSLQLSGGDLSGLVGGPVAWVCYAIIAAVLLWPLAARMVRRGGDRQEPPAGPNALEATPDRTPEVSA